jgi:hypothetical protein
VPFFFSGKVLGRTNGFAGPIRSALAQNKSQLIAIDVPSRRWDSSFLKDLLPNSLWSRSSL